MEKSINNKIKLGVFVTIGAALLIIGIYFVGERQRMFSSTFLISAIFKDINGLQVGNNVRFSGINVGTIDAIKIVTDSTVQVNMIIDKESQKFIKKDATAIIGSDGLMGNKILIISSGHGSTKSVKDNDFIVSLQPVSFEDIMKKMKITADNSAIITTDLSIIVNNIRTGKGTIGKLFMDTSFAQDIDKTVSNVKQGSAELNQTIDAAQESFLLRKFFKKKKKKDTSKAKEDPKTPEKK